MRVFSVLTLLFTAFMLLGAPAADAQEDTCTTATSDNVSPDMDASCDIHARRLDYRGKTLQFRDEMKTRAENYIAPNLEMRRNYKARMDEIYANQGTGDTGMNDSVESGDIDFTGFTEDDLSAVMDGMGADTPAQ